MAVLWVELMVASMAEYSVDRSVVRKAVSTDVPWVV